MLTGNYQILYNRLADHIPGHRLVHDELRTLAYGTDASFYRLIPKLVVVVDNEDEVLHVLRETRELQLPVTFRAAGTSLSGQAISDSVLIKLGSQWTGHQILDDGLRIRLQPGVIGSHANVYLAPYRRKIGPDPASINSCMIGGIAANNASGMCCGTAQNSYNTLQAMRVILADGSVLDTGDTASVARFRTTHAALLERLTALSARVRASSLAGRIRRKFKMKNTTGYSLNALIDFDDPVDILQYLMIGSEGTLGFISSIVYNTVPEHPHKASSLMLFPDIATACNAVSILKRCDVSAVEIMDRASLKSVESQQGMPGFLRTLDNQVAALLVETRAPSEAGLRSNIESIQSSLVSVDNVHPVEFTVDPAGNAQLWNIRKGLFPSVGAMRQSGTTVIIEDVAFALEHLAEATLDLQKLFAVHGYDAAIIFGHALEGNLHFVFAQSFNEQAEIDRYARFMSDLAELVVKKYDGSLKAEHGTGRNMAPFVELEWGAEAYDLMKEIKTIIDPENLLNPGVILNADPNAHIANLKPLPAAHPIVDKCIECGFCEVQCPSKNLTITPRQRIVAYREMSKLITAGTDTDRLEALRRGFMYDGDATCATDGLCAMSCPVSIDTGELIKELRRQNASPLANSIVSLIASNFSVVTAVMRGGLNLVDAAHSLLGTGRMSSITALARRMTANTLPAWNPATPKGAPPLDTQVPASDGRPAVVYFPTCINRTLGAPTLSDQEPLIDVIPRLLLKAGYAIRYPDDVEDLCCGMAFASKGFSSQGNTKAAQLEAALQRVSDNGRLPILVDMSPCHYRMKQTLQNTGLRLYDQASFANEFLLKNLTIRKTAEPIAIHHTCSSRKLRLENELEKLARSCAETVVVPEGIGCCGWAGDRGFNVPELTASALSGLREKAGATSAGYSTSRTCEIGLTLSSNSNYQSVLHLLSAVSGGSIS